eukprot:5527587-Pyramimonas_sp.AAC.1
MCVHWAMKFMVLGYEFMVMGYGLMVLGYEFMVLGYGLMVMAYEIMVSGYEFMVLWYILDYGVMVMAYEIMVSGYEIMVSSYEFMVSGYEFMVSGYEFMVTRQQAHGKRHLVHVLAVFEGKAHARRTRRRWRRESVSMMLVSHARHYCHTLSTHVARVDGDGGLHDAGARVHRQLARGLALRRRRRSFEPEAPRQPHLRKRPR